MATYTINEAKKILNVDDDFDDDIVSDYIQSADETLDSATGYSYSSNPNGMSKQYVRMSLLMQHYNPDGYNKDYDFTHGMSSLLLRLKLKAYKYKEKE